MALKVISICKATEIIEMASGHFPFCHFKGLSHDLLVSRKLSFDRLIE